MRVRKKWGFPGSAGNRKNGRPAFVQLVPRERLVSIVKQIRRPRIPFSFPTAGFPFRESCGRSREVRVPDSAFEGTFLLHRSRRGPDRREDRDFGWQKARRRE